MSLTNSRLWRDFIAICDCGGRQSGTPSEQKATALLKQLGQDASGVQARVENVPYGGWEAVSGALDLPNGKTNPINPLLRTVATAAEGLTAEVIDLGRGTMDEFEAHKHEIAGRIVMVRHELMFNPGTVHRRLKYQAAVDAGAVGFLISGPVEGSLVAGSSGRREEPGIPAAGISPETAQSLRRVSSGWPKVTLHIETRTYDTIAQNLIFDIPGSCQEWVVLSAHIDGHALGESALDNASGLAVALEVTRQLAKSVASGTRGLRLALFNVEEWALTGSAVHLAAMKKAEHDAIALNVNLDTVAGADALTALTSGFEGVEPFLLECASAAGQSLGLFRPLQMNSDHGNFAAAGIPAFRLVAGFGDYKAPTSLVLTDRDKRDLATLDQLANASKLTLEIVSQALKADSAQVLTWRSQTRP
ncbi:M28 family peptidase [Seohaeicola saemankumensis]|uniref:M28 family peptidase n=1 Tax=Seohaeicola saemankumensis TaxID=481181 RepID=UPI0035CF02A4